MAKQESPISVEEFISRHSAYYQSLGFDIQFAGYIWYLLDLNLNDEISYEKEDDFVVVRNASGNLTTEYYQVKHSKEENANLTDADDDFWKSIDNWLSLYDLQDVTDKDDFFVKSKFVILTNKKLNNKYYQLICDLQNGSCTIGDFVRLLKNDITLSLSYQSKLQKLIDLGELKLNQFLHSVYAVRFDNFLGQLYQKFVMRYINPIDADSVFNELVGALWKEKISGQNNLSFSGKSFTYKYKGILEKITPSQLLTMEKTPDPILELENENEASLMLEQLESVSKIPQGENNPLRAYYLSCYFKIRHTLERLRGQNVVTPELETRLDSKSEIIWKRVFVKYQTKFFGGDTAVTESEKVSAGAKTFDETISSKLELPPYVLDEEFSSGWFLKVSNQRPLKIVWHFDWYKKFINKL